MPECSVLQWVPSQGAAPLLPKILQDTELPCLRANVPPLRPNRHGTPGLLSSGIGLAKASGGLLEGSENSRADRTKPTAFYPQQRSFRLRTTCSIIAKLHTP